MILVTGGTGFVGSNLQEHLDDCGYEHWSIGSNVCDLTQQNEVEYMIHDVQPDVIIHLAASVGGIGANRDNPGKFMYDNLSMGTNLINSASENNCKKFIMLGTVCSYPKHTKVPFRESSLWDGYPEETNAPYGIAKKALAELGFAYNQQYGFNFVNILPTNLYGPYDNFDLNTSHVIPAIIRKVKQAKERGDDTIQLWGTGVATRDFLYVDDLCRAVIACLENDVPALPINIGTGVETRIIDVTRMIAKKMGYEGGITYDTASPDGQPRRCLDYSLAKELLNYEPTVDLSTGLDRTIEYAEHNIF